MINRSGGCVCCVSHCFSEQPVSVRVVVENFYDDTSGEKGEQVGAFIEITLEPK